MGTQVPVAQVARAASGSSPTVAGCAAAKTLRAQLNVTAMSGVAVTINVVVQDSLDGSNWNTIGTFAEKSAVGREVINITAPFADRVRVSWTIAGTSPSVTFEVVVFDE